MKDKGLDMGLIETRDTSARNQRGWGKGFWGFRKMFWDYLKKLHVPFFDDCCEDPDSGYPVRYNPTLERLEWYDGRAWGDIVSISETTSTTTTTTEEPTTTTTTTTTSTTTTTTVGG